MRRLFSWLAEHSAQAGLQQAQQLGGRTGGQRLAVLAQRTPQPQVDVRADNITKYQIIADVVKKVRLAGIRKVGFVSTPER